MKILDRYLTTEVIGPFFLGVFGFVLVMVVDLLFTFVDLIINKGIPLFLVLKLLVMKLPSILVLTYPVATLFATTMAMGRLSHDNELSAFRTSGISFTRLIIPIAAFALFISFVSYTTNEKIVPRANFESTKIIREIIRRHPLPEVRQNVFFKDVYNRHFYIRRLDSEKKTMEDIVIYELAGERLPRILTAKKAILEDLKLILFDGNIHKFDENGKLEYQAVFTEMKLKLSEDPIKIAQSKSSDDMNASELKEKINTLQKGGISTKSLKTDLYMKFSIPLTCLVFALIGLPLSIPGIRTGRTWGMVITIVVMFSFYVFASVFRSLGRGGIIGPFMAAFFPQILFGLFGSFLIVRESFYR